MDKYEKHSREELLQELAAAERCWDVAIDLIARCDAHMVALRDSNTLKEGTNADKMNRTLARLTSLFIESVHQAELSEAEPALTEGGNVNLH